MMFTRANTEAAMIALEKDLWVTALRTASNTCWDDKIWNLSTEEFDTTASLTDDQLNDREVYNMYFKCGETQVYQAGVYCWFTIAEHDSKFYMPTPPSSECWGDVYASIIGDHPTCEEVDLPWTTVFPNPSSE